MRLLLISGGNSLSHVAKCVVLERALGRRGHQIMIAASSAYRGFLDQVAVAHTTLPDIQESDGGALPALTWFRSPDLLRRCVQAEIDLIKAYRPHRVIGVFRFTTRISTSLCNVAYDAFACGCMMPDAHEVLGFGPGETGETEQALYLDNFFRFSARKVGLVMKRLGLAPVRDIRELLVGDHTFLWDFPQFMPIAEKAGRVHTGPLSWHGWPAHSPPPGPFPQNGRPIALVTLGTGRQNPTVVGKAVRCLLACGCNVSVTCGGHRELMQSLPHHPRIHRLLFAPLRQLLPRTDLVICHGGQMTIFEALAQGIPVFVIPSQPEQAHNGFCLERIRCGWRLSDSVPFKGDAAVYAHAFIDQADTRVSERIQKGYDTTVNAAGLRAVRQCLADYGDPETIAEMIEHG